MQTTKTLYIPGLGDAKTLEKQRKFVKKWLKSDFFDAQWHTDEQLEVKLERLTVVLQAYGDSQIKLIASSAGGSLAMIAYGAHPKRIQKLVLISAKFRNWQAIGPEYLRRAPQLIPAVKVSDQTLQSLNNDQIARITTVRPLYDNVITTREMPIKGARNRVVPAIGHPIGIVVGLLFAKYW